MNNNKNQQIITRFAPSPTGALHVGGARTALFNYLFAKQNNGKFILRIEDTDKERSKKEFEEDIINSLKWLGIDWDEFYKQSERVEIYKKYLEKLLSEDKAYLEDKAIRFKNPNKKISFDDLIRGKIEFDTTELGDFVIAKDIKTPLYHFAVVVDDNEMEVTHVIRGEDHISNTPRQILIQEAIGFPRPIYGHIPLILGTDRAKLSKRHGESSVMEYKKIGYLPEVLINFISFLGWNPGTEKEIYSMEELIKDFSLKKIQKGGAVFNIEKLNWINSQYIKNMDIKKLTELCIPYLGRVTRKEKQGMIEKIIQIKQERMTKLTEVGEEINYFFEEPIFSTQMLVWKNSDNASAKINLQKLSEILCDIKENQFTKENIKQKIWSYTEENGKGNVLWPFRVALTGLERSPEPFIVAEILGKKITIERLQNAINKL